MGDLCSRSIQCHLEGIRCTCLKMACNSTMTHCRVNRIELRDFRVLVEHILGTFDLLMFKIILGSFWALIKIVCNSKAADRRVEKVEIEDWRTLV